MCMIIIYGPPPLLPEIISTRGVWVQNGYDAKYRNEVGMHINPFCTNLLAPVHTFTRLHLPQTDTYIHACTTVRPNRTHPSSTRLCLPPRSEPRPAPAPLFRPRFPRAAHRRPNGGDRDQDRLPPSRPGPIKGGPGIPAQ